MPTREVMCKRKFETREHLGEEKIRKNLKKSIDNIAKISNNAEKAAQLKKLKFKQEDCLDNEMYELLTEMGHLNFYGDTLSTNISSIDQQNLDKKKSDFIFEEKENEEFDLDDRIFTNNEDQIKFPQMYFNESENDKFYQIHAIKNIEEYETDNKDRFTSSYKEDEFQQLKNIVEKPYKSISKIGKAKRLIHVC